MAYKDAVLARKNLLKLDQEVISSQKEIDATLKEIEADKNKAKLELEEIIQERNRFSMKKYLEVSNDDWNNNEERLFKRAKLEKSSSTNDQETVLSKVRKFKETALESEKNSEHSSKKGNQEESLIKLKSKLDETQSEIDALNRTKSEFIWLLKEVIKVENKRKGEKKKDVKSMKKNEFIS